MKTIFHLTGTLVLISIFVFNSCETIESESECDASQWTQAEEPIFYYYNKFTYPILCDSAHELSNSDRIQFLGTVTKVYCSGEVSSTFPYNSTYYTDALVYNSDIKMGQGYQFKFQNDKDHLWVQYRIKVFYDDGYIFESEEIFPKIYYSDLSMDIYAGGFYFRMTLVRGRPIFYRVTS